MTTETDLTRAGNIAWHARVNGLESLEPRHILEAMAALETLIAAHDRVEAIRCELVKFSRVRPPVRSVTSKAQAEAYLIAADMLREALKLKP